MIDIFKGALSLKDILTAVPYKVLLWLRDEKARLLSEEQEQLDKMTEEQNRQMAREQILAKDY